MNKSLSQRRASAFTLIEVMAVIGILVLVIAIVLPALASARKSARRTAISSQLQTITTALTAYEQDFKALPPLVLPDPTDPQGLAGSPLYIGALGLYLEGPGGAGVPSKFVGTYSVVTAPKYDPLKAYRRGDCVSVSTTEFIALRDDSGPGKSPQGNAEYWAPFPYTDGVDGFGIPGAGGKTWGPYIQPEKLKMRGAAILDIEDNPIAYFPALPVKNNVHVDVPDQTGSGTGAIGGYVDFAPSRKQQPQYNVFANYPLFVWTSPPTGETIKSDRNKALTRIRALMGDLNDNGKIDPGETAVDERFLLWSAGLDGNYGPALDPQTKKATEATVRKCDDITNFPR